MFAGIRVRGPPTMIIKSTIKLLVQIRRSLLVDTRIV